MKLITKDLEQAMCLAESNCNDIKKARIVLENALSQQFLTVALGMYSSEIINGKDFMQSQIDEIEGICSSLFPIEYAACEDKNVLSFVANGIYRKKWPILQVKDLHEIEIRIFNRYVYFWNAIEINEQLAILGSNYRFFFAGAMQLAGSYARTLIGYKNHPISIDARFIYGEIATVSISVGGPVFDFKNELAVSPFLEGNAPGFSIGDTAVVRRKMLGHSDQEYDVMFLQTLFHEIYHTITYSLSHGAPFSTANWNMYIKRDICRFLIVPHSKEEISEAFGLLINDPNRTFLLKHGIGKKVLHKLCTFWDVFDSLYSVGIVAEKDGLYYCVTMQEGKSWNLR